METERKTLNIDKCEYDIIQAFCKQKSYTMSSWVTQQCISAIRKEETVPLLKYYSECVVASFSENFGKNISYIGRVIDKQLNTECFHSFPSKKIPGILLETEKDAIIRGQELSDILLTSMNINRDVKYSLNITNIDVSNIIDSMGPYILSPPYSILSLGIVFTFVSIFDPRYIHGTSIRPLCRFNYQLTTKK
jgi:hypothetical protein